MRQVTGSKEMKQLDLDAWVNFLRAHASITRALNQELVAEHGLTINDYEVLLVLSQAEEGRLRRVDIAQRVLLTASGVTRLLDGLERSRLVAKAPCPGDARVSYAVITDTGRARLATARQSHLASVRQLFNAHYSEGELAALAELLGRLPGCAPAACSA